MRERILSFIGLASKAGKLVSGDETCERAVKAGKTFLVIVAGDASHNTTKKFSDMCKYRGVEFRVFGDKAGLGKFSGKEIRSVIAITGSEFAKKIVKMIDDQGLEYGGGLIGES